jgi:hypothetical protein
MIIGELHCSLKNIYGAKLKPEATGVEVGPVGLAPLLLAAFFG